MNITVKARHMDITDAIREYVETKAGKLDRFYDNITSVEVVVDLEAEKPWAEFVVRAKPKHTFVASQRDEDMYACIDQCYDKLSNQLRKFKERIRDHQGPPHSEVM